MDDALARRLGDIEERLREIEAHLGLPQVPPPLPRPPLPRPTLPRPTLPESAASNLPPITADRSASDASTREPSPQPAADDQNPITWDTVDTQPARPAPVSPPPHRANPTPGSATLEHTIGLKWTGWVGAVILIVGLALGYKFAYDQGWLTLAPVPKLILMVASGVCLLGAGEVIYRRINRVSAAGFYGAGVAVFFLAGYAGHAWYGLFEPSTALLLMGAAAAIGILVAARADLVSVAVLAIIGGNIAPLVLGQNLTAITPFLLYLASLQWMALGLCAWRSRPKWWCLRGVSLATTTAWMLTVCGVGGSVTVLLVFAFDFWLSFQGELVYSTRRARVNRPAARGEQPAGIVYSLLTTASLVVWLLMTLRTAEPMTQGEWLAGLAVLLIGASIALTRMRGGILASLARGYRVQAVLLLILAVPVALEGPILLFGWMLLAVGLALLAAMRRDRLALVGAAIVWGLTVIGWAIWAVSGTESRRIWATFAGQMLEGRLVVAGALAVSGHLVATVLHHARSRDRAARTTDFGFVLDLAALLVLGVALVCFTRPAFATWTLIGYAWALCGLSFVPLLSHLGTVAIVLLGLTAVKWVALDLIQPRLQPRWMPEPGRPFLNLQAATGYALAASLGVMGWLVGRRSIKADAPDQLRRQDNVLSLAFTVAMLILGLGLTFEISRAAAPALLEPARLTLSMSLWQTLLWCGIVIVWVMILRVALLTSELIAQIQRLAIVLALILAMKFAAVDVLGAVVNHESAGLTLLLNQQVATALVVGATLCLTALLDRTSNLAGIAALAVPAILWVTGTAEIDRYAVLQPLGPVWIVRQAGWSIYWSGLAVVCLIVGFAWKWRSLRYASLALLAVTLLKVTLIDLSGAGTGWRILSFLGLGLLLLATSVLYGKFSERPGPVPPAE